MVWPTVGSRTAKEQNRTERDSTTCSEPSLAVDRAPSGVRVVPVAGELCRRSHDDLAVLVRSRHDPAGFRVDYLKPENVARAVGATSSDGRNTRTNVRTTSQSVTCALKPRLHDTTGLLSYV